jgi:putative aldouronate transport system permease protein
MRIKSVLFSWIGRITVYSFLIFVFIAAFYPFWNIFVLSLNEAMDSMRGGILFWPRKFTLASYQTLLKNDELFSAARLTLLRVAAGTPFTLLIVTMCAYALSRRVWPGWKQMTFFFIFTMYFSGGLIPSYMVIKSLGLIDNFLVFIFPKAVNVFWIILIRTYMEGLPHELTESAKIDGANDMVVFVRIVLPLCLPILATITLFSAIGHWNEWYDSYIYTYKPELTTLSVLLVRILNQFQTGDMLSAAQQLAGESKRLPVSGDSIRMATTMVVTMPIILVYPLLQRYFIKGMLVGSIKG